MATQPRTPAHALAESAGIPFVAAQAHAEAIRAIVREELAAAVFVTDQGDRVELVGTVTEETEVYRIVSPCGEVTDDEIAAVEDFAKNAVAKARATDEREREKELARIDELSNLLDEFVDYLGGPEVYGEHTSANCPWRNALQALADTEAARLRGWAHSGEKTENDLVEHLGPTPVAAAATGGDDNATASARGECCVGCRKRLGELDCGYMRAEEGYVCRKCVRNVAIKQPTAEVVAAVARELEEQAAKEAAEAPRRWCLMLATALRGDLAEHLGPTPENGVAK